MNGGYGEKTVINFRGLLFVALFAFAFVSFAWGQEHSGHRPQDLQLHQKFYKTWMMPDNRAVSCCHDEDCRPAEAHLKNGKWWARQEGDQGDFTEIPPNKVEEERDSPDGRSHLCGRRYGGGWSNGFTVFCFKPGGGA
jgi:hypothetical protein